MIQHFYKVPKVNDIGTVTDLGPDKESWADGVYASLAPYGEPLSGYPREKLL